MLLFLWISGYLDWLHAQRVETLGEKVLCSPCAQAMQLPVMLASGQEGHRAWEFLFPRYYGNTFLQTLSKAQPS